jgi:competence protein ComGC
MNHGRQVVTKVIQVLLEMLLLLFVLSLLFLEFVNTPLKTAYALHDGFRTIACRALCMVLRGS